MNLTRNFTYEEMRCKCPGWCEGGEVDQHFIRSLQKLRSKCGFAFPIISGVRCPRWNKHEKGQDKSYHLQGRAADIYIGNNPRHGFVMIAHAHACGLNGIGIRMNSIHLDNRDVPYMWSYDENGKPIPLT